MIINRPISGWNDRLRKLIKQPNIAIRTDELKEMTLFLRDETNAGTLLVVSNVGKRMVNHHVEQV